MVSFKYLALGTLVLAIQVAALTQEEADTRCQKKLGAGYVAKKNAEGSYIGCEIPPPPPQTGDVCFENEYTDPKTGEDGCCSTESLFSFDPVSKEGKCCPEGSIFAWDSDAKKGDCCKSVDGQECEYKCSCQIKKKSESPPKCPEGNGKTWFTGGKTYKLTCDMMVGGASIGNPDPQPDLATCATKCAALPTCKSVDWYQQKCWYKTHSTAPPFANGDIDNWYEVPTVTTPAPVPEPTTQQPRCPADSGKFFISGSKKFKIFCDYTTGQDDLLTNSPSANPETCANACAARTNCHSATWYNNGCWLASPVISSPGIVLANSIAMLEVPTVAPPSLLPAPAPAPAPISCPADNNRIIELGGKIFKLFCDFTTMQADLLNAAASPNPEACATACAGRANCFSATWYGSKCWLASPRISQPPSPPNSALVGSIAMLLV